MKVPPLNLQLIYENGRPVRAIIDVAALETLLEAAEDLDDIEYLNSLKAEDLEFVSFDEYLLESERRRAAGGPDVEASTDPNDAGEISDRHRKAS